jgi:hypothetical protein
MVSATLQAADSWSDVGAEAIGGRLQAYVRTLRNEVAQLQNRVETLEARLTQNSTTSSRPPSSDSPYKKPRQCTTTTPRRKAGGKPGHWVERILSLRETCRLQARSTYMVLVERSAVCSRINHRISPGLAQTVPSSL